MASFTVVECPASKYIDIIHGVNITFFKRSFQLDDDDDNDDDGFVFV